MSCVRWSGLMTEALGSLPIRQVPSRLKVNSCSEFKVLKYAPVLVDIQVAGAWAIEVGNADASYRMSAKDEPVSVKEKGVVRVLKRQSDGSWKFAVVGLK
jgi:hypothetical protein